MQCEICGVELTEVNQAYTYRFREAYLDDAGSYRESRGVTLTKEPFCQDCRTAAEQREKADAR